MQRTFFLCVCTASILYWLCKPVAKAIAAVIRGSPPTRKRYSSKVIGEGLRYWYSKYKQLPRGVSIHAPAVREWSLRNGVALQKLATCLYVARKLFELFCDGSVTGWQVLMYGLMYGESLPLLEDPKCLACVVRFPCFQVPQLWQLLAAVTHSSKSQATRFKRLTRRSESSKNRVLGGLKAELRGSLGAKRPNYNENNKKKSLAPLEDVQSAT